MTLFFRSEQERAKANPEAHLQKKARAQSFIGTQNVKKTEQNSERLGSRRGTQELIARLAKKGSTGFIDFRTEEPPRTKFTIRRRPENPSMFPGLSMSKGRPPLPEPIRAKSAERSKLARAVLARVRPACNKVSQGRSLTVDKVANNPPAPAGRSSEGKRVEEAGERPKTEPKYEVPPRRHPYSSISKGLVADPDAAHERSRPASHGGPRLKADDDKPDSKQDKRERIRRIYGSGKCNRTVTAPPQKKEVSGAGFYGFMMKCGETGKENGGPSFNEYAEPRNKRIGRRSR